MPVTHTSAIWKQISLARCRIPSRCTYACRSGNVITRSSCNWFQDKTCSYCTRGTASYFDLVFILDAIFSSSKLFRQSGSLLKWIIVEFRRESRQARPFWYLFLPNQLVETALTSFRLFHGEHGSIEIYASSLACSFVGPRPNDTAPRIACRILLLPVRDWDAANSTENRE